MCLVGIDRYRSNSVFSHPKTDEDIINLLLSVSYSSVPTFITLLPTKSSPPSNRAASLHRVILRRVRFTMSFPVPRLFPFSPPSDACAIHAEFLEFGLAVAHMLTHSQSHPFPADGGRPDLDFCSGCWRLHWRIGLWMLVCMSIEANGYLA